MSFAEIAIHIHQDQLPVHQEKLEEEGRELEGVTAVGFNYRIKHWLSVAHDSESITPRKVLNLVREWDKDAVFCLLLKRMKV